MMMHLRDTKAGHIIFLHYFRRACGRMSIQTTCLMRLAFIHLSRSLLCLVLNEFTYIRDVLYVAVFRDFVYCCSNSAFILTNFVTEMKALLI